MAETKKYLDSDGLLYFWQKLKTKLNDKQDTITSSNKLSTDLISGLARVATSGSYTDLTNQPGGAEIYYDATDTALGSVKGMIDGLIANKQNTITTSVNFDAGNISALKLTLGGGSATNIVASFTDQISDNIKNTSLATAGAVMGYVGTKISGVLSYKGTKTNYSELPTNPSKGDVYNVTNAYNNHPAGTNYAWNGTEWDALGGAIDLSSYLLASDFSSITNSEIDTILAK